MRIHSKNEFYMRFLVFGAQHYMSLHHVHVKVWKKNHPTAVMTATFIIGTFFIYQVCQLVYLIYKFSNKPKHLIITSLDGLLSSSGVFFFPFCSLLLTLFCMSRERYTSSYKYLDFPTQITILLDIGCERSILEEEERDWARTKWGETGSLFQHQHLNCWKWNKTKNFN